MLAPGGLLLKQIGMATGKLVNEAEKRLRVWLAERKPKPGDRLPVERALAEELGVGHYALNRAMARLIAEGRVERQGYKLLAAAGPRTPDRQVCHLVIARRSEHLPSYRRIARELDVELVVHGWDAAEEVETILQRLDSPDTSGVICDPPADFGRAAWTAAALQLTRHGIPVVSLGWSTDELSSVSVSFARGVELAITHLGQLGHEEIGLVTAPAVGASGVDMLDRWRNLCMRGGWAASAERIHFQTSSLRNRDDIAALAELLAGPWKNITGLVLRVTHDCAIQALLAELARRGRRVPESLSLVVLGNARTLLTATPRITAATIDMALWHEMAFDLVIREVRKRKAPGVPVPSIIQVMPRLTVRNSTAALIGGRKKTSMPDSRRTEPAAKLRQDPAMTDEALAKAVKQPYSIAARASLSEQSRFHPLDLGPCVNRPLNFRRGWLGDLPLRCFAPGTHEIHGVPFHILGGTRRADRGAIVFRSAVNTTGYANTLPERLLIPVGMRAEAIYVLHGCGYAKFMQPFASYHFHGKAGELGSVPLVSLGSPPPGGDASLSEGKLGATQANIQDWWSDFPHLDFPHARMAPLPDRDESSQVRRHVFLYTLEWINPTPEVPIRHVEIRVDPSVATTLGVLALTVVQPKP